MKRGRSTSPDSEQESLSTPKSKFQRIEADPEQEKEPIWCNLPPTCSQPHKPTACYGVDELEAHYARFHAYICEADGCNCVFDREHYLTLHQNEIHNPLALVRKERGESIYQCFLPSCTTMFPSPHQRKRHLISVHHFEETFFFTVTKYGIGDQIRAWGTGEQRALAMKKTSDQRSGKSEALSGEKQGKSTVADGQASTKAKRADNRRSASFLLQAQKQSLDQDMEELSKEMSEVSLVPTTVRFGRGGAKSGFQRPALRQKRRASLSDIPPINTDVQEDVLEDTIERQQQTFGVRFSDDVAIRFMSPVDPQFYGEDNMRRGGGRRRGQGRRAKSVNPGSDDESGKGSRRGSGVTRGGRGKAKGPKGARGEDFKAAAALVNPSAA